MMALRRSVNGLLILLAYLSGSLADPGERKDRRGLRLVQEIRGGRGRRVLETDGDGDQEVDGTSTYYESSNPMRGSSFDDNGEAESRDGATPIWDYITSRKGKKSGKKKSRTRTMRGMMMMSYSTSGDIYKSPVHYTEPLLTGCPFFLPFILRNRCALDISCDYGKQTCCGQDFSVVECDCTTGSRFTCVPNRICKDNSCADIDNPIEGHRYPTFRPTPSPVLPATPDPTPGQTLKPTKASDSTLVPTMSITSLRPTEASNMIPPVEENLSLTADPTLGLTRGPTPAPESTLFPTMSVTSLRPTEASNMIPPVEEDLVPPGIQTSTPVSADPTATPRFPCELPEGLDMFSIVTDGDAKDINSASLGERQSMIVGGGLSTFPGQETVIKQSLFAGFVASSDWNFNGYLISPFTPFMDFKHFEYLAGVLANMTVDGSSEVLVLTSGGEFTKDQLGLELNPSVINRNNILVVFDTSEPVTFLGPDGAEELGFSILAPFSEVTLRGEDLKVGGFVVARTLCDERTGEESLQQGGTYTGPLFCLRPDNGNPDASPTRTPLTATPTSDDMTTAPTRDTAVSPQTAPPTVVVDPPASLVTTEPTEKGETPKPTDTPSLAPTAGPVTAAPTDPGDAIAPTAKQVPSTSQPTRSPVTPSPTEEGDTVAPTVSPPGSTLQPTATQLTAAPTDGDMLTPTIPPVTTTPTKEKEQSAPTALPSSSFTDTPATVAPTREGDTVAPGDLPTVAPLSGAPTTGGGTFSPSVTSFPTAPPLTETPTNHRDTFAPTVSPSLPPVSPTGPPRSLAPTKEGETHSPTSSPSYLGISESPVAPSASEPSTAPATVSPTRVGETRSPMRSPTISPVASTSSPSVTPTTLSPAEDGETRFPTLPSRPTESPFQLVDGPVPSVSPVMNPPTNEGDTRSPSGLMVPFVTLTFRPTFSSHPSRFPSEVPITGEPTTELETTIPPTVDGTTIPLTLFPSWSIHPSRVPSDIPSIEVGAMTQPPTNLEDSAAPSSYPPFQPVPLTFPPSESSHPSRFPSGAPSGESPATPSPTAEGVASAPSVIVLTLPPTISNHPSRFPSDKPSIDGEEPTTGTVTSSPTKVGDAYSPSTAPPTSEPSESSLELSDTMTMRYALTLDEDDCSNGSIFVEIACECEAWVAFAVSPDGLMPNSDAVIGLPDSNEVLKYTLGGRSLAVVTPRRNEEQTLLNTFIEYNGTHTVMQFVKRLVEPNELEINTSGSNNLLWASGSDNTLGQHPFQARGSVELKLSSCDRQGSSVTPSVAEPGSPIVAPIPSISPVAETAAPSPPNQFPSTTSLTPQPTIASGFTSNPTSAGTPTPVKVPVTLLPTNVGDTMSPSPPMGLLTFPPSISSHPSRFPSDKPSIDGEEPTSISASPTLAPSLDTVLTLEPSGSSHPSRVPSIVPSVAEPGSPTRAPLPSISPVTETVAPSPPNQFPSTTSLTPPPTTAFGVTPNPTYAGTPPPSTVDGEITEVPSTLLPTNSGDTMSPSSPIGELTLPPSISSHPSRFPSDKPSMDVEEPTQGSVSSSPTNERATLAPSLDTVLTLEPSGSSHPSRVPSNAPSFTDMDGQVTRPTQSPFQLVIGPGTPTMDPTVGSPTDGEKTGPPARLTLQPSTSTHPSRFPSEVPSEPQDMAPVVLTLFPTVSSHPSRFPSEAPSDSRPTQVALGTPEPTLSSHPSRFPSESPSGSQGKNTPILLTERPSYSTHPSRGPSATPSQQPSQLSKIPSPPPSASPSLRPSGFPSAMGTGIPMRPVAYLLEPSFFPSSLPSDSPSARPSGSPDSSTRSPSNVLTGSPTRSEAFNPTESPSAIPIGSTIEPSAGDEVTTEAPSPTTSVTPGTGPPFKLTRFPTVSAHPSRVPSSVPSATPTSTTGETEEPSNKASSSPAGMEGLLSMFPSQSPSVSPSGIVMEVPTLQPSHSPSFAVDIISPQRNPPFGNVPTQSPQAGAGDGGFACELPQNVSQYSIMTKADVANLNITFPGDDGFVIGGTLTGSGIFVPRPSYVGTGSSPGFQFVSLVTSVNGTISDFLDFDHLDYLARNIEPTYTFDSFENRFKEVVVVEQGGTFFKEDFGTILTPIFDSLNSLLIVFNTDEPVTIAGTVNDDLGMSFLAPFSDVTLQGDSVRIAGFIIAQSLEDQRTGSSSHQGGAYNGPLSCTDDIENGDDGATARIGAISAAEISCEFPSELAQFSIVVKEDVVGLANTWMGENKGIAVGGILSTAPDNDPFVEPISFAGSVSTPLTQFAQLTTGATTGQTLNDFIDFTILEGLASRIESETRFDKITDQPKEVLVTTMGGTLSKHGIAGLALVPSGENRNNILIVCNHEEDVHLEGEEEEIGINLLAPFSTVYLKGEGVILGGWVVAKNLVDLRTGNAQSDDGYYDGPLTCNV